LYAIDRESFLDYFELDQLPDWNCSSCQKGKLIFSENNITLFETKLSKTYRKDDDWNYGQIDEHFCGILQCSHPKCKETFSIAGKKFWYHDVDQAKEIKPEARYSLSYVYPTIHIFKIDDNISYEVYDAIVNAFRIFWLDKSSCANAIRKVVEAVLDDKKIVKTKLEKGKRVRLSLHKRLGLFEDKSTLASKSIAEALLAVKWIGNAGSHELEVDTDDLLNGFELLQFALQKMYGSYDVDIAQLTKQINKRK
jgi:hypothetical protein